MRLEVRMKAPARRAVGLAARSCEGSMRERARSGRIYGRWAEK